MEPHIGLPAQQEVCFSLSLSASTSAQKSSHQKLDESWSKMEEEEKPEELLWRESTHEDKLQAFVHVVVLQTRPGSEHGL